jgi:hypothetical protein
MECADNYGGQIRALPGVYIWGYLVRTRAARSFKQSPCWLDEKSNGRKRRNMDVNGTVAQI